MLATLARPECVVEVGPKVVGVFEPDRETEDSLAGEFPVGGFLFRVHPERGAK